MNFTPQHRARAPKWIALAIAAAAITTLAACAGGGAKPGAVSGEVVTPVAPGLRGYPFAASRTTTRDYFGTSISDDFGWLENAGDPYTRSWIAAENAYGRRYLDAMPARAELRQRLKSLLESSTNAYSALAERGGLVFALKSTPPAQRPVLVALKSLDDLGSERVVFDPNALAADGSVSIEFFRPSPDGRRVAIALSAGDASTAVVRVVDVLTGQVLPGEVAHVLSAGAGGDVAWAAGGAGFFCTQSGPPGSPALVQVVFHRLGATGADRVELSSGLPRLARVRLESARDGRHVLALVENGRGGDVALYMKPSDTNGEGAWRRLSAETDGVRDAQFGDDDALWLHAIGNAPRGKILRVPLSDARAVAWDRLAAVAMPVDGALQRFAVAGGTLYVAEGLGSAMRLRAIDLKTRRGTTLVLPPGSGVAALARVGRSDVAAQLTNWAEPSVWTRVAGGRVRRTALAMTSDASFNDCDIVREVATSRDGTPVTVDILRPHGTRLDGRNPLLLMPAGSLGAGVSPDFDVTRRVWLDRGGVIALATLRGATDAGEAWRADGVRTRRQNGVDDLLAAADMLVKRGYTQPALLAARARGDGATAVAAAMTQRPELFRAVSIAQGRYDLLSLEHDATGQYDEPGYGSVRERAQFDALHALSPLHAVRDGAPYPAVLLSAGMRDGRVNPAQSRKMTARLQQADPSGHAILLRTDVSSGQAAQSALSAAIEQAADEYGFLLHEVVAAQ
ncbi:MAG TPA: prolyl oligopeptidase family serine peptidase [Burkholderiaceae bacterium]